MAEHSLSICEPVSNGKPRKKQPEKHGMTGTAALRSYAAMIDRCENPKSPDYPRYGGRGITVCDRWRYSFLAFREDMGDRPPGTQLDRIDNDRGYEPGNCRWVTSKVNNRNRWNSLYFEVRGERLHLNEIAERTGIHRDTLLWRVKRGATIDEAIAAPISDHNKRFLEFRGQLVSLVELERTYGINKSTIVHRISKQGMTVEEAVTRPLIKLSGRRRKQTTPA